jgi:uncharacterized membrane protein
MQGVLSGLSLAAGCGVGVFARWCWSYLELPVPVPSRRSQRLVLLLAAIGCVVVAVIFLRQASELSPQACAWPSTGADARTPRAMDST